MAALVKYQLVMFDFDGTLADTFPYFLKVFDQVADRYRFRRLDPSATESMRGLHARQIMRHHQVAGWKLPFIARHARALMAKHIGEIGMFPGIAAALADLHDAGATLALVTSNSRQNVVPVLGAETVARLAHLECGISMFGKAAKLRRLVKQFAPDPSQAIFVGDEIRDAEAARKAGVAFGAVSWGYTRLDALAGYHPRETFARVEDLTAQLGPGRRSLGSSADSVTR